MAEDDALLLDQIARLHVHVEVAAEAQQLAAAQTDCVLTSATSGCSASNSSRSFSASVGGRSSSLSGAVVLFFLFARLRHRLGEDQAAADQFRVERVVASGPGGRSSGNGTRT